MQFILKQLYSFVLIFNARIKLQYFEIKMRQTLLFQHLQVIQRRVIIATCCDTKLLHLICPSQQSPMSFYSCSHWGCSLALEFSSADTSLLAVLDEGI